jgi:hypothetical protein
MLPSPDTLPQSRSAIRVGLALLAIVVLSAAVLAWLYIDKERERDLQQWQLRLGLIAEHGHH